MRILGAFFIILLVTTTSFYFYPDIAQTDQARYRLTATIDTPIGPRSGSGVWGYSTAPQFNVSAGGSGWVFSPRVEGEAIPIDLGNGQTLFMVLGARTVPHDYGGGLEPASFDNKNMRSLPKSPLVLIALTSRAIPTVVQGLKLK